MGWFLLPILSFALLLSYRAACVFGIIPLRDSTGGALGLREIWL